MNPDETILYVLLLAVAYWIWSSIFGSGRD